MAQQKKQIRKLHLTPRGGSCALPNCKLVGSVEEAHGGNSSPSHPYWYGAAICRQNRKAPRPGIESGLQEPESGADPTEANRFGTVQQSTGKTI